MRRAGREDRRRGRRGVPPALLPRSHKGRSSGGACPRRSARDALWVRLRRRQGDAERMKRVLVTGGAGFIGSHTVDLLLEHGYEVRIIDSLQPRVHPRGEPSYISENVEFIKGDVASRADMELVLEGMDYVFHLAAYQD